MYNMFHVCSTIGTHNYYKYRHYLRKLVVAPFAVMAVICRKESEHGKRRAKVTTTKKARVNRDKLAILSQLLRIFPIHDIYFWP